MKEVRWLIRRDMGEVLEIERQSFACPWTEEEFLLCLRQRNCIGSVYEQDNKVIGFMIYELHKNALNILNLAVHHDHRRQLVGYALVHRLIDKLSSERRRRITTMVRSDNIEARAFFHAMGFRQLRVHPKHYIEHGVEDDGIEMVFVLSVSKTMEAAQ